MWITIEYSDASGFEYVLEDLGYGDVEKGEKVLERYINGALKRVFGTFGFPSLVVWFIKEKESKLPQIITVFIKPYKSVSGRESLVYPEGYPEGLTETQWMEKNEYKLKDTIEGALVEAGVTNTISIWVEI